MHSFRIVEIDLSGDDFDWTERPCENAWAYASDDAKTETRTLMELAGGGIRGWFAVDEEDLAEEGKEVPGYLVCFRPKAPVAGTVLGDALHMEACEGIGYVPAKWDVAFLKSLPVITTIEAEDPTTAGAEVREAEYNKGEDGIEIW